MYLDQEWENLQLLNRISNFEEYFRFDLCNIYMQIVGFGVFLSS